MKSIVKTVGRVVWVGGALFCLSSCGAGGKQATKGGEAAEPSKSPSEVGSKSSEVKSGQLESARVASPKLLDRRARSALAPDTLGVVRSQAAPPKSAAQLYRTVAPATVIIRVEHGLGSGVIIDKEGWIVTNHHVVDGGKKEDFVTKVDVLLGKLSKATGGMERLPKALEAQVYKVDKIRDLALIKLTDPPKNLPTLKIAPDKPTPGQRVVAIGHAGAGMLWAIKAGEVSALGKLSEHLSTLARFGESAKGRKAKKQFRKFLGKQNLGLVIQSTCKILPGDSGGPLVTRAGDLVGVNAFSNRDRRTGGLVSFHVHRDEVVKFLKEKPKKVARLVPDPWKDGGGDAEYDDADLDGQVDALVLKGRRPCTFCPRQSQAVMFDVDQDSAKGGKLPTITEAYNKRKFDAEVVYLREKRNAFIWYDTNNDSRFDVLLYDQGATGRVSAAYRIKSDGDLRRDAALRSGHVLRPALVSSAGRDRFVRLATAAFPRHFRAASNRADTRLPSAMATRGKARPSDMNRDGKLDSVRISTAFSSRLMLDTDQKTRKRMPPSFPGQELSTKYGFEPELSIVSQGSHMWVWYDSDNDGRFDLVLHSPRSRLYVAAEAFSVDSSGNRQPLRLHVGRKLIRPALFSDASTREQMKKLLGRSFFGIMSARENDGLNSFPDPVRDHRGAGYRLLKVKGASKAVIGVAARGSDGYLIDLDQSSLRAVPLKKVDARKAVVDKKFDAEFAYFQRNGLAWSFYDTNNDKRYDVVLFSSALRSGKANHGFRIDKKGNVKLDESLNGRPMASHSLFARRAHRAKMKSVSKEIFGLQALEK